MSAREEAERRFGPVDFTRHNDRTVKACAFEAGAEWQAAQSAAEIEQLRALVRDLTDSSECWYDHNGGCQQHYYLNLRPSEMCPHAEAKQILKEASE